MATFERFAAALDDLAATPNLRSMLQRIPASRFAGAAEALDMEDVYGALIARAKDLAWQVLRGDVEEGEALSELQRAVRRLALGVRLNAEPSPHNDV